MSKHKTLIALAAGWLLAIVLPPQSILGKLRGKG